MKLVSRLGIFIFFFSLSFSAHADAPPSLRQPSLLGWMHGEPVGEQPGWTDSTWVNFELSEANVWSVPMTMKNNLSGSTYDYQTDYEQTSAILEIGQGFGDFLGVSVVVPFGNRWGGFMDHIINGYHHTIDNNYFERDGYAQYQTTTTLKTDGTQYFNPRPLQSISNIELKLKFWLLHWYGTQKGSCPCGLSFGSQTKFPTEDPVYGGTTGHIDQTAFVYLGIPLFSASAFWATASYSWLGANPAIAGWPRFKSNIMYEGNFDIAFSDHWGLVFMARAESPFLDGKQLSFQDSSTNPAQVAEDRMSSGWNSLVHWRGSEGLGFRYRADGGNQFQIMGVEDFGVGPYDDVGGFYSNNAPDFNIVMQLHTGF